MEGLTLALFCGLLLLCLIRNLSILYALAAGLLLFMLYGKRKGFSWRELFWMASDGVKTVSNILLTFLLIGIMTGLWRAAGTIPVIVCEAAVLVRPSVFLLMTFLLNCLVSVLTGTAFGTAATMGVICAAMAAAMKVNLAFVGGAVLAGAYFGDRCSPVSTSALLVAELTGTDIYSNLKRMVRSAAVPFVGSCLLYLILGLVTEQGGAAPDLWSVFSREFSLSTAALLPALVILVLSLFRVRVKTTMLVSILTAIPICLFIQKVSPAALPGIMLNGYRAADVEVGGMVNGGGIVSMLKVSAIVCLSSSYSGIFRKTGLLDPVRKEIERLAARTGTYAATLCTAAVSVMIACNQTLSIMLTHQLCSGVQGQKEEFALNLEDSAVIVAPLIPWCIANAVPLAAVGAPSASALFAFFLYLLPLWRLTAGRHGTEKQRKNRKGFA